MSDKYLTLAYADLKVALTPEEQAQLRNIVQKVMASRRERRKPEQVLFTLNMADVYAQRAIEAYIAGVQEDTENGHKPGPKAALAVAVDVRQKGLMGLTQRLPT